MGKFKKQKRIPKLLRENPSKNNDMKYFKKKVLEEKIKQAIELSNEDYNILHELRMEDPKWAKAMLKESSKRIAKKQEFFHLFRPFFFDAAMNGYGFDMHHSYSCEELNVLIDYERSMRNNRLQAQEAYLENVGSAFIPPATREATWVVRHHQESDKRGSGPSDDSRRSYTDLQRLHRITQK